MRLIDSEPLVEDFEGLARSLANARYFSAADAIQGAAEKLRNAPTIDAEPVRHGQWRRLAVWSDGVVMECTACQISTFQEEGAINKYCPNCGAKMDEEVQHD